MNSSKSLHTTFINPSQKLYVFEDLSGLSHSQAPNMATVTIKYSEIPPFLHAGAFYRNLDADDPDDIIEIPQDCFAWNLKAKPNQEEFSQLIRIMTFWMLDEIPEGVLYFCSRNKVNIWRNGTTDFPEDLEANILSPLLTAYSDQDGVPLTKIIQSGKWEVIKHAVCRVSKSSRATAIAAKAGNLKLLVHLHEEGFAWHKDTGAYASLTGQLECLKYACENGYRLKSDVYAAAAAGGHLPCIKFAHERGVDWHPDTCSQASRHGHLHCLIYAHENGCTWNADTTLVASQKGSVECLRYALEHGCPHNEEAVIIACTSGYISCLRLLHQHGAVLNEDTAWHASMCPNSACLSYLHENGCEWDDRVTTESAKKGLVNPLSFALEHGCPYSDRLMCTAAESGRLSCLKYLIEMQGLYMDEEVFMITLLKGNLPGLRYLIDQDCPYLGATFNIASWDWYDTIYVKRKASFLHCVQVAMERGWKPDSALIRYLSDRDYAHCRILIESVSGKQSVLWVIFIIVFVVAAIAFSVYNAVVYDNSETDDESYGIVILLLISLLVLMCLGVLRIGISCGSAVLRPIRRVLPHSLPITN